MDSIESLMIESKVDPCTPVELMNVIEDCFDKNYFKFQNKWFAHLGCQFPLLSEILMDKIESTVFDGKQPVYA